MTIIARRVVRCILLFFCVCVISARGADLIEITKTGAQKSSLDLSGLSPGNSRTAIEFRKILKADLDRSGWFVLTPAGPAAFTVDGLCEERGATLRVNCRVAQMPIRKVLLDKSFSLATGEYRRLAHLVADEIVAATKGCPGFASTRIALIGNRSGAKELYVCDADGQNLAKVTDDRSISISPAWGPDGARVYYTSYCAQFPYIYSININSSSPRRERVSGFPGMNMSPAISPDGRRMALSLSKDGNPDLYVMDLATRSLTRVTRTTPAGEVSPSWSPDGRQLVFVSDSSGRPQLFVMSSSGSAPRRITFHGSENVAPDWGRNGLIAYTSLRDGLYRICVINPVNGEDRQLTDDGTNYEDPSWAPDGRHIVCGRSEGRRSGVYILDTMGDGLIRLLNVSGEWSSPAWSSK